MKQKDEMKCTTLSSNGIKSEEHDGRMTQKEKGELLTPDERMELWGKVVRGFKESGKELSPLFFD